MCMSLHDIAISPQSQHVGSTGASDGYSVILELRKL